MALDAPPAEQRRDRLREQRLALPDQPGVYLFSDDRGRVVYVGKAKSIRKRVASHFSNPTTYGIAKRLADEERKRLRRILDEVKPANHGLIVRTAAEGATAEELRRDVRRLLRQWESIESVAKRSKSPARRWRPLPATGRRRARGRRAPGRRP